MKRYILLSIFILLLLYLTACTGGGLGITDDPPEAPEPFLLKIGHELAEDSALHRALLEFANDFTAATKGRFAVEIYPYFQLGDAPELVSLTVEGTIDMCFPLSSDIAALPPAGGGNYALAIPPSFERWGAMDGFYLYTDIESAYAAIDGEIGADMAASLADVEGTPLLCLGFVYEGALCIASAGSEIASPANINRRTVALSGSNQWLAAYNSKGAIVDVLPLSEVYPALMRKKVAVYQATPAYIASMYLDDHSTTLSLTEHAYAFRAMLVNQQWYAALEEQDRLLLDSCLADFLPQQRSYAEAEHTESIETLRNRGMGIIELTPEQKALWQ